MVAPGGGGGYAHHLPHALPVVSSQSGPGCLPPLGFINRLLSTNFGVMERLGDPVLKVPLLPVKSSICA